MNGFVTLSDSTQKKLDMLMNSAKSLLAITGSQFVRTDKLTIRMAEYCYIPDKDVSRALNGRPRAKHMVYIIKDISHKIAVMDYDGRWLPMYFDQERGLEERGDALEPKTVEDQKKMINNVEIWLDR